MHRLLLITGETGSSNSLKISIGSFAMCSSVAANRTFFAISWKDELLTSALPRGVVGWERVGTAFPHLCALEYKTWMRSDRCASDTQIRTASQSQQWNRKIQCRNSFRRMPTLFEPFGAVFLFVGCGNGVPTPLF